MRFRLIAGQGLSSRGSLRPPHEPANSARDFPRNLPYKPGARRGSAPACTFDQEIE